MKLFRDIEEQLGKGAMLKDHAPKALMGHGDLDGTLLAFGDWEPGKDTKANRVRALRRAESDIEIFLLRDETPSGTLVQPIFWEWIIKEPGAPGYPHGTVGVKIWCMVIKPVEVAA